MCTPQSQESWQSLPPNTPTPLPAQLLHLPRAEGKSPCHGLPGGTHKPWLSPAAQQRNLFMNGSGTPRLNYEAGIQSGRMCSCFLTDWRIKRAIEYILSFHMTASPSSPLPNQETSRACAWREEDLQCSGPTRRIRERLKRTCIQKTTLLCHPQQKNYFKSLWKTGQTNLSYQEKRRCSWRSCQLLHLHCVWGKTTAPVFSRAQRWASQFLRGLCSAGNSKQENLQSAGLYTRLTPRVHCL